MDLKQQFTIKARETQAGISLERIVKRQEILEEINAQQNIDKEPHQEGIEHQQQVLFERIQDLYTKAMDILKLQELQ